MALINCKECGKEISDTAKKCPNCGYEDKNNTTSSDNSFGIIGMIIGFISFFLDFFGLVSATGLVFSIIGLTKSNKGNAKFAIIGIVCNSIELILKIIQLCGLMVLAF